MYNRPKTGGFIITLTHDGLYSSQRTSDQLKLSKSAREGGSDKFAFFETTGSIRNNFKTVYDLHMRVEALSKALVFYDLVDVFQILDGPTVTQLSVHLEDLLACQSVLESCDLDLLVDPANQLLIDAKTSATNLHAQATSRLQATDVRTTDLITSFKGLDESTIR